MAKKELVSYATGFGNFIGVVDPYTGQIMCEYDSKRSDNDRVFVNDVNEVGFTGFSYTYDHIARVFNLRSGAPVIGRILGEGVNWDATFPGMLQWQIKYESVRAVSSDHLIGLLDLNNATDYNLFGYSIDTDTYVSSAISMKITDRIARIGNSIYTIGVNTTDIYHSTFNGSSITSIVIGSAVAPVNIIASTSDGDLIYRTSEGTAGHYYIITTAGVPVGDCPVANTLNLVEYQFTNSSYQCDSYRVVDGRLWGRTEDGLIMGVLLSDNSDVTIVTPETTPLNSAIIQSALKLTTGEFVITRDGLVQVLSSTGQILRTLPGTELLPSEEDTYALRAIYLDTYSVSGTTTPSGKTVHVLDSNNLKVLSTTVSDGGGSYSLTVLGDDPVILLAESGTAENAKVRTLIPVELVL